MRVHISSTINSVLRLFVLISLMTGCQSREFTLTVSGEDDAEAGDVFVNGKWVGTMAKEGERGPQLVMTFPKGTVTVEVKKEGYLPFFEVITVSSAVNGQEIHVKLARDVGPDEKKTGAAKDQPAHPAPPAGKLPVCPD